MRIEFAVLLLSLFAMAGCSTEPGAGGSREPGIVIKADITQPPPAVFSTSEKVFGTTCEVSSNIFISVRWSMACDSPSSSERIAGYEITAWGDYPQKGHVKIIERVCVDVAPSPFISDKEWRRVEVWSLPKLGKPLYSYTAKSSRGVRNHGKVAILCIEFSALRIARHIMERGDSEIALLIEGVEKPYPAPILVSTKAINEWTKKSGLNTREGQGVLKR